MPHVLSDAEWKLVIDNRKASAIFRMALIKDNSGISSTFTVDPDADTLTMAGGGSFVNLVNGCRVTVSSSGTIPGGLPTSTTLRVIQASGSTCKLCLESTFDRVAKTGTPINISGAGSGTHTITELTLNIQFDPYPEQWVRYEASYGTSGRQSFTLADAVLPVTIGGIVATPEITAVFTPDTTFTYRQVLIIRGGSATAGDTSGVLSDADDSGTTNTVQGMLGKNIKYKMQNRAA